MAASRSSTLSASWTRDIAAPDVRGLLEEIQPDRTPVGRLAVEGARLRGRRPDELARLHLEHEEARARDLGTDVGGAEDPACLELVDVAQALQHRGTGECVDTAVHHDAPRHVTEQHPGDPGLHTEALGVLGPDL